MSGAQLNIVFLGPSYPYRGGIASFTERLALEFNKAGHSTRLITFTLQYPSFLFPGKTQFSSAEPPQNLNIIRLINSVNPLNWIRIGLMLKKMEPDLIIVRFWMPFMAPCFGTILNLAKRNRHTRVICIADNIIPHEQRRGDLILTKYFINKVDSFVVMSETVRNDLLSIKKNSDITLIPHPLFDHFGEKISKSIARANLGIPDQIPLLLFFGLIREYKGLDLLIEAMSDERVIKTNAMLLIAGECYEDKVKYSNLIKKYKLENKIVFHDHFIQENLIKIYFSAADVLVQPYKNATQSGVTPLAMHFDLPMIVTNAGGLKEMVNDNITGIVTAISSKAIADGIIKYLQFGKEHFVVPLQEHKKIYSWNSFYIKLIGKYHVLVSKSK